MKKAAFHTLGCKVNTYETEAMKSQLKEQGYEIVSFSEAADVYIINTCTVTNMADQKSRQMLHRARKKNPDAVIAAVGCYAQTFKEDLIRDNTADIIIGNSQKSHLHELLEEYFNEHKKQNLVQDLTHEHCYEFMKLTEIDDHTRAFIKIQDGCNQFCTYCMIPYARGRARSRSLEDIMKELRMLASQGFKEVVFTGIHLSSYGKDLNPEKKPMLLEAVLQAAEIEGIERIRLGSLEPGIITEEFIRPLSECSKFCPHFHLSLQSGSDTVLKRMNRHYTAQEYYENCQLIRSFFEHPAITTDIIVGFPQETEDEFKETCEFVKKVEFAQVHAFPYSRRKGTKADAMSGQIADPVKKERMKILSALIEASEQKYNEWYIGREVEILAEEESVCEGRNCVTGHTKQYLKCAAGPDCIPNTLVTIKIARIAEGNLLVSEELLH